jgi:hypothetical protein
MVREKFLQDTYLCIDMDSFSNILMHSSLKLFIWIFLSITASKHLNTWLEVNADKIK